MADLKIEYVDIGELKTYANNAKIHTAEQIEQIKQSIEQFGMNDPIAIWKNNEIIEGHGRLIACMELGFDKVPIIRLDDLTDEERRAYMLVHNKLTMNTDFDFDILQDELMNFTTINMEDFGLVIDEESEEEFEEVDEFSYYGDERERTFNSLNFNDYNEDRTEGIYEIPTLKPVNYVPKKMIGFNYAKTSKEYDACIHFYLDDYQFERIWNKPKMYFDILKKFDCCLTPNFSIYYDMPKAMKIWNTFRSRLLGQMMQDYGLRVIPIVYWGDESTYDFAFDGLPENSTLSIYTVGKNRPDSWDMFYRGLTELINRKHPKRFLVYGNGIIEDYDYGDIEVFRYENEVTKRWSESKG